MQISVTIITFRDIFQDEAGKKSRFGDEFRALAARIILDRQDMAGLGIADGQRVLVKSKEGSVVVVVAVAVNAAAADDEPHPQIAYMTASPWSNQLLPEDFCSRDQPWTGIAASISPTDESVTQISELLQKMQA